MMQLVSVAEEAGLNFTWSAYKSLRCILAWYGSIPRSAVTNWRARGVAGRNLSKGAALWLQLILDYFEINAVLNSIIIVRVRCGGGVCH